MTNPLYNELIDIDYVPIKNLDEELPPEFVVLYLKNLSQIDKRFVIQNMHEDAIVLDNNNPSIEIENPLMEFCLALSPFIPVVTIDKIEDIEDPKLPYTITVSGTISNIEGYEPNSVKVIFNNIERFAEVSNNKWTISLIIDNINATSFQTVFAIGTSLEKSTGTISSESEKVSSHFNVIIPVKLQLLPVENVQITVEEVYTLLPVENVNISFIEMLSLKPVENVNLSIESFLGLIPVQKVKLSIVENLKLVPVQNVKLNIVESFLELIPVQKVKLNIIENLKLIPVQKVKLDIVENLTLAPVQNVKLNVIENLTLFPVENVTLTLIDL